MKNLKLFLAAFTLIFAVLVSTANENQSNSSTIYNCDDDISTLENGKCPIDKIITEMDNSIIEKYDLLNEEMDDIFDFNTNEYLPLHFDQYNEDKFNLTAYELLNQEMDDLFDFDTKSFLPENFNQYNEDEYNLAEYELLNEEEDELFKFNTLDYLPKNLHTSK